MSEHILAGSRDYVQKQARLINSVGLFYMPERVDSHEKEKKKFI